MAHPVSSSSQPAQLSALEASHAENAPKPKETKAKKLKVVDGTAYPLEVRFMHSNRAAGA
jgi:hypothetical protein